MQRSNRLMAGLLAAGVVLVAVPVAAADLPEGLTDLEGKLVVIHTNDTHGRDLEGAYTTAAVAQLKQDLTAAGGDTYGAFLGKTPYKTGVALEQALVDYTATVLEGVITEKDYGKPAGRITVNTAPVPTATPAPTASPTAAPTAAPTAVPTAAPTAAPTAQPAPSDPQITLPATGDVQQPVVVCAALLLFGVGAVVIRKRIHD